ncbi:ead/Ea22-like family protein [Lelliottia amnigena]|uniref:ead/Ea22-like family protein n=1 Tax=Lelliottia amnigena TaxID=61646 RepID=UPI0020902AC2|nr:ead/Ea22-like family protein [Lelliottia amnigena]USR61607.1 ead/Ea22-like family protein [Lelliottia amnigena]
MSTNKQALKEDALAATAGSWVRESGEGWEAICCDDDQGNAGFIIAEFQGKDAAANRKFVESANPATVLALLDELDKWQQESSTWQSVAEKQLAIAIEAEKRIAELTAPDGNAIAWESTTPVYIKFITDERYQKLRPGYQKWYKPCRCSNCAAGITVKGDGE